MSFKVSQMVWEINPGFLTGVERLVLLKLSDYAGDDGSSIYPSLKRLSAEVDFCLTAVQKALKSLVSKGVLAVVKPFTARMPNIYRIDVEIVKNLGRKTPPKEKVSCLQEGSPSSIRVVSHAIQGGARHYSNDLDSSRLVLDTTLDGATHQSRVVPDTTKPINNLSIEPITLLSVSKNSPFEEEIQNTPSGGAVERASSQLQSSGFGERSFPCRAPSVGYSSSISFSNAPLTGCFLYDLQNTSKTAINFDYGVLPMSNIRKDQEIDSEAVKRPLIDMLSAGCDDQISFTASAQKKSKSKVSSEGNALFDQWYAVYPRKVARKKAFQAFGKAIKAVSFDSLLDFTRAYGQSVGDTDKQYIPHPATWLNGERWEEAPVLSSAQESVSTSSTLSAQPSVMEARLEAFVSRHPQLGSNAFAFSVCEVSEEIDKVILHVPSRFYLDKIDLYHRELEQHFGKRVELSAKTPPLVSQPQPLPKEERHGIEENTTYTHSSKTREHPVFKVVSKEPFRAFRMPKRMNLSPYKPSKSIPQGTRQGVG